MKIYRYTKIPFNCHLVAFFETSDLKDIHIFYFYLQSNGAMPILKFQSESLVLFHQALKYLLNLLEFKSSLMRAKVQSTWYLCKHKCYLKSLQT